MLPHRPGRAGRHHFARETDRSSGLDDDQCPARARAHGPGQLVASCSQRNDAREPAILCFDGHPRAARRHTAPPLPADRAARRARDRGIAVAAADARPRAARRRPPGAVAAGIHGRRGNADRPEALPREPRLRSPDLGLRAQRRLQQPARDGAGAEDPLPASPERPHGEPRRLEPGRSVRHVRGARSPRVRPVADHHRQPGDVRSRREPVAAAGQGALQADRPPDGDRRARHAPEGEEPPSAEGAAGADLVHLLADRRRGAAAGGDDRRRSGAAREHPRAGQPPGDGLQPACAAHRRRPPRPAGGPLAAAHDGGGQRTAVPVADRGVRVAAARSRLGAFADVRVRERARASAR